MAPKGPFKYYVRKIWVDFLNSPTQSSAYVIFEWSHGENLGATSPIVGRICPPGWNRVKVPENIVGTAVVLVAPVDTSLSLIDMAHSRTYVE